MFTKNIVYSKSSAKLLQIIQIYGDNSFNLCRFFLFLLIDKPWAFAQIDS